MKEGGGWGKGDGKDKKKNGRVLPEDSNSRVSHRRIM